MKKTLKKFLIHASSVALSLFMAANFVIGAVLSKDKIKKEYITVAADQPALTENIPVSSALLTSKQETQYVKDVKFITGESLEEAKKSVPKGYTLVETDLNQGAEYITAVDDVYLAYSTTTNPDEAITDIKMMNMNGGFVVSDYDTQIDNVNENIKNMVSEFKAAVETFVVNYRKGTSGAKAAYRTLSEFTIDELNNKSLADYFVYSEVPDGFYLKLLLNAHTDILASILSALTMAVQGEPGDTWLDRLAKIEDPNEVTNTLYWDRAVAILPHFESFLEVYESIDHRLYRGPGGPLYSPPDDEGNRGDPLGSSSGTEPKVELTGAEFFYELAYMTLEQYTFGDGSAISEWLVCPWLYEEMLYPLIDVLTPAEYAMMHLCGPMYMIFATAMSEAVYKDYVQRVNEISQEMGGKCSVWAGVDTDLLRSSIGITDKACRAIVETEAEREFNNQGDSGMDTALKAAGLFAAVGAVALGVGAITVMITGSSLFAGLLGTTAVAFTCKAAIVTSIAGITCAAAGVAVIAVALVVAVIYLAVWLIDWITGLHPDLTDIPEYMYDYVIDGSDNGQFLLYEVARDQNGNPADVNAFDGKQWHAPYISRDKAAGEPIEADFMVRLGDGRLDEGYGALSAFGNINCENLNLYAFDDEVNGIFVSYRQKDLTGDYARGKYLSAVRLFTAENEEHCKLQVKNKNFSLYNVNLTPDAEYCTYLGYQTTNKQSNALTDIRFAYNYSSTPYSAGGGNFTYAESGSSGKLTLYMTRISAFGSPITSDFLMVNDIKDAPVGYEPVNMFGGGPAVSLNIDENENVEETTPYYLYFLPSKAYVSGREYLGGIATVFDVPDEDDKNSVGQNGSVDKAIERLHYKKLVGMSGNHNMEGAIVYTTTYNPYRAIYNLGAMTSGGERGAYLSETITYDGCGYMLATRFAVTDNGGEKEKISFDTKARKNDSKLYVAGVCAGGTPLTLSDIVASDTPDCAPEGFREVNAFLENSGRAADLAKGFNYSFKYTMKRTIFMTMSPIYLYVRGTAYQEGKYLSSVYIVSKEQLTGGNDIPCKAIDNSYILNKLALEGAHAVMEKNLNLADSNNTTILGYTKDAAARDPITDMFLYYAGTTNEEPKNKLTKNNIEYHLVSDANIFCEENEDKANCKRVYLYTTTNPAAGAPIVDMTIDNTAIVDGWQTVRTQNGKALYDDMDDYSSDMWFIHIKRAGEQPKYISEIVVGWGSDAEAKAMLLAAGCDYMLQKDFNSNVGAHSDYVYLGYKRTSDPDKAIRNIISVHDEEYTTFTKNGATYYKVEGNLNSYTNALADDIYLFYTKDAKAGTPIISLGTSDSEVNWSHGEGQRYVVKTVLDQNGKPSDLNKGCGYQSDYIYLLQTRDKNDQSLVASMIGEGSIFIIIAFTVVSGGVIATLCIIKKKRKKSESGEVNHQTDDNS